MRAYRGRYAMSGLSSWTAIDLACCFRVLRRRTLARLPRRVEMEKRELVAHDVCVRRMRGERTCGREGVGRGGACVCTGMCRCRGTGGEGWAALGGFRAMPLRREVRRSGARLARDDGGGAGARRLAHSPLPFYPHVWHGVRHRRRFSQSQGNCSGIVSERGARLCALVHSGLRCP